MLGRCQHHQPVQNLIETVTVTEKDLTVDSASQKLLLALSSVTNDMTKWVLCFVKTFEELRIKF